MYIQLTTGKDSLAKTEDFSESRNVMVTSQVYVGTAGGTKPIIPVFEAYKKKLRLFRETAIVEHMPATTRFQENIAGDWYINRHEVAPGTEVLLEYRRRTKGGAFSETTDWLMLVADQNAALMRLRLELPYHPYSAVPAIFAEGRLAVVKDDRQISKESFPHWLDYFGISDVSEVGQLSYIFDPNQAPDDQVWAYEKLDNAPVLTKRAETVVSERTGKKVTRIRRGRRITVR